jgi:hypothetical protein
VVKYFLVKIFNILLVNQISTKDLMHNNGNVEVHETIKSKLFEEAKIIKERNHEKILSILVNGLQID